MKNIEEGSNQKTVLKNQNRGYVDGLIDSCSDKWIF